MRRHALPLLVLLAACDAPTEAPAPPLVSAPSTLTLTYGFNDLGIGTSSSSTNPTVAGMNFWAQMVGNQRVGGAALAWYADFPNHVPPTPLPVGPGHQTAVVAINDRGVILGWVDTTLVMWNTYTSLPVPFTVPGVIDPAVKDFNNAGMVAGIGTQASTGKELGFRWTASGGTVWLSPGANQSRAIGVNSSGVVVGDVVSSATSGNTAAMWPASSVNPVILPGYQAIRVNSSGVVLGWYWTWTATSGKTDLPSGMRGDGLSDKNRVAGSSSLGGLCPYECGVTLRTTDPNSYQALPLATGFRGASPSVVNTCGWVGGIATTTSGIEHIVVWKPTRCDQ